MKAMKIASGFAVTALAAAIAGQAAAADIEMSASGAVKVQAIMDLEAETREFVAQDDTGHPVYAEDTYSFEVSVAVANGPFSATVNFDDDNAPDGGDSDTFGTGTAKVTLDDVQITDGAFSFGQVGELRPVRSVLRAAAGDQNLGDYINGVNVAARYTNADAGVSAQLENTVDGAAGTDFGIGISFAQDMGTAQVSAQYQMDVSEDDPTDDAAYGVGLTAAPSDTIGLTAAYVSDSTDTQMAVKVTADLGAASVYVRYKDIEEATETKVGASTKAGEMGVSFDYAMAESAAAVETNTLDFKVTMPAGGMSAYVDYKSVDSTADYSQFGAGVATTSEAGITYKADYDGGEASAGVDQSKITLTAQYSF